MQLAADAGRAVKEVLGALASECEELLDALHRQRRMHAKDKWLRGNHRDGSEILDRIEGQIPVEPWDERETCGCNQERVAVGSCSRGQRETDGTACARSIVYEHADAQRPLQLVLQGASQEISAAPRREGNQQADRLFGITGRVSRRG